MGTTLTRILEAYLGRKDPRAVFTWLATFCTDQKFCFKNSPPELSGI
jgi:hypothetical protein